MEYFLRNGNSLQWSQYPKDGDHTNPSNCPSCTCKGKEDLQEKVKSNWKNLPLIWTVCPLAWCKLVSGSTGLSMIVSLIHANAICFYIHVQHYLECDRHVTVVQDMALVV